MSDNLSTTGTRFTGTVNGVEVAFTLWLDGTGQMMQRDPSSGAWLAPVDLTAEPLIGVA